MAGVFSVSREFNDTKQIVRDLLENAPRKANSETIGLLACDPQLDCVALSQALQEQAGFTVVGGTTLAFPLFQNVEEVSATLTVISKQGLVYSVGVSQRLHEPDSEAQMQELYSRCLAGVEGAPKMLMVFVPLVPGLLIHRFVANLFTLAGGVPVIGGMHSDDLGSEPSAVFLNGETYSDRMVLLALAGEIRPVFAADCQLTVMSDYAPTVTQSQGNVVSRVDDMTFCAYMESVGFAPEKAPEKHKNAMDTLFQYGPLPVLLYNKITDDDGVPEIRGISGTDPSQGSAVFSGDVPVGTRVCMGTLQKNDVVESAERCVENILKKMQQHSKTGYVFSTLFVIDCVARYFTMVGGENKESALLRSKIPPNLATYSGYMLCEIGPVRGASGALHNRSYNESLVICAL